MIRSKSDYKEYIKLESGNNQKASFISCYISSYTNFKQH